MRKFFLYIFLMPVFCFSQNVITNAYIHKVEEKENLSPVDYYTLNISPGYRDYSYKIKMIKVDSAGKETILSEPEINVQLIVHRTDYKMPDGKYEWDYITEVKSNDTFTDEYIQIPDCSNLKHLSCSIHAKKNEKYKIKLFVGEKEYTEFLIGE